MTQLLVPKCPCLKKLGVKLSMGTSTFNVCQAPLMFVLKIPLWGRRGHRIHPPLNLTNFIASPTQLVKDYFSTHEIKVCTEYATVFSTHDTLMGKCDGSKSYVRHYKCQICSLFGKALGINCGLSFWDPLSSNIKLCKKLKHFRNQLNSHLLNNITSFWFSSMSCTYLCKIFTFTIFSVCNFLIPAEISRPSIIFPN